MSATQTQVGGSHYKSMAIQPIEFTLKNGLGFCEGNVIKYVSRHKSKGGRADLEKAIHYLQLLIEKEYPEKAEDPTAGDGYRMLVDGDKFQDGDQHLYRPTGEWITIAMPYWGVEFNSKSYKPTRRKVEKGTK